MSPSGARDLPFNALGSSALTKLICVRSWRHGLVHRLVAAAIVAWLVQDLLAGRARRAEPADVKVSVETAYDDPSEDWAGWRTTVPRACAPSFRYRVPVGRPLPAKEALRYCLPLLSREGYVALTPELMAYSADTLTLDSWSIPDCGLQFGDQLLGVLLGAPGKDSAAYTASLLGGRGGEDAGGAAWSQNRPATKRNRFFGDWQGVNQSNMLSMRIYSGTVELGNGQQLPILEENSTHIVIKARDGTPATGRLVGPQLHWDVCETQCELERMPEYISKPTRHTPMDDVVAIGNSSEEKTWWQDPTSEELTLLFSIDAATTDQELDNVLARKLQQHATESGIPPERMHIDVTKLWIKDRTLELISYYNYDFPWQYPGADSRDLYFPLEVHGTWLSQTSEAHDWSGLADALRKAAEDDGTISFLVQSVGAEPCFIAPPGEDHVQRIDDSRVHVRSFTSHSARMVTREVSGTPLQHVDPRVQMKAWSYWSSAGYNGDVWIGDSNFVDHSHSAVTVNFKVGGGHLRKHATLHSCNSTSNECGKASHIETVTDSWMGMQASSVRLSVPELLNRSDIDISNCVDRCSVDVELRFENKLWTHWMMSPWELFKRNRKGEVSLSIRVSGGNHHSAFEDVDIVQHGNSSIIHTAEHGGAVIGIFVAGEFGYADPGFFLAHVGALLGILVFGLTATDFLIERMCCRKDSLVLDLAAADTDAEFGGPRHGGCIPSQEGVDERDQEWCDPLTQLMRGSASDSKYAEFGKPFRLPAI